MAAWTDIHVAREFAWPRVCSGCMGANPRHTITEVSEMGERDKEFVVAHTSKHLTVDVPVCDACVRRRQTIRWTGYGFIGAGVVVWLLLKTKMPELPDWQGYVAGGVLAAIGFWLRDFSGQTVRVLGYDDSRVFLSFRNARYAGEFRRLNAAAVAAAASKR